MNRTKKFSALAVLLLALTVVGCGNEKEQDTGRGAGASDAIGAGESMGTETDGDAQADGTENPEGDDDIAEEPEATVEPEMNGEPNAEEQELYNDGRIIITLTGMTAVKGTAASESGSIRDGILLDVDFTNHSDKTAECPNCYDVYIGDTLVYSQALVTEQKNIAEVSTFGEPADPGKTVKHGFEIGGEGLYDQLLEKMEISIIFKVHNPDSSEADEFGYILSPKATIPVVLK